MSIELPGIELYSLAPCEEFDTLKVLSTPRLMPELLRTFNSKSVELTTSDLKNLEPSTLRSPIFNVSATIAVPYNFVGNAAPPTFSDVIFIPGRMNVNPGIEILGVNESLLIIATGVSST